MKFYVLSVLLVVAACSFKKSNLANQTQNGHEELYSEPEAESSSEKTGLKKLIIAATNDIHGNYGTKVKKIRDTHNKDALHIELGGVDFLSTYLKILREKNKSVVLVDSGDILPPEASDYRFAHDFYSTLNYSAIAPGLTDMSLRSSGSKNPVRKFAEESSVPVLASNLYELKTARGVEWKGTNQYRIVEVNGIKVGIIGLLPDDISTLTPVDNRVGLYLESMLQSTLHQARRLRSLGAQVIVVLTHQGLDCGVKISETSKLPLTKVNFEPKKEDACDLQSPLGLYLQRLPARLVDLVVAGRNHRKVANFINDIAVVSGFEDGTSFSYVEFMIDEKTSKLVPDKTVIHQPVMVCREFFKETNDCYTEDPSVNHRERIPAKFLGVPVERDESLRGKFTKFFDDASIGSIDEEKLLEELSADIFYSAETSGITHLVSIEVSGAELSHWLEESYNQDELSLWKPSPFGREEDSLILRIKNEPLIHASNYKVITDLESLQRRASLWRLISSQKTKSLTDISWRGRTAVDEVSLKASGISH